MKKFKIESNGTGTVGTTPPKVLLEIKKNHNSAECPKTLLYIDVNAGYMEVQNQDKQISISISRYNELINSKWNLKDIYSKNGMITSLWRNKETGEKKEGIGTYPPSEPLNLNAP